MAKPKLKPTAGYILIEPEKQEKTTLSGIVLPDSHEEKPQKGKVLAVGQGEVTDNGTKKKSPCEVGQSVVYKKWGGNEYQVGSQEYLFVKFEDIMGIEK